MTRRISAPFFVIENVDSLAMLRERQGLSRRELADKTGLRLEYISQYERGYGYPAQGNYNKLAKFFDWEEWE